MSINLKDVRIRIARLFPAYFEASFEKCYDLRAVDIVADVATVAMSRINVLEQQVNDLTRRNGELAHKVAVASVKAPEVVNKPAPEPTTRWFVNLEGIPGAVPFGSGLTNPPNIDIIGMIKAVRNVTTLGLKEAKDVVDYVRDGKEQSIGPLSHEQAAGLYRDLTSMGGKASIQPGRKV